MMMGNGDMAIPAVVLDFFLRFDSFHGSSLFLIGFVGYAAGIVLTFVALAMSERGQPALLWIFPSILVPVIGFAAKGHLLSDLWRFGVENPRAEVGVESD
jgi:hypothetical protein